jgi:shikimate dehydrogenase
MRAHGDPDLKIYGIFGYPLSHTVSPAIQNTAFDYHQLKSIYFAFERNPPRFKYLMRHLKTFALDGFNLTVPFKETVLPYLDRLSGEARQIGSVNTIKKEKKSWVGYNTDGYGFLAGLKECRFNISGKKCVVLGAGGSARTVVHELAKQRARSVLIANRTKSKALKLAREMGQRHAAVSIRGVSIKNSDLREGMKEAALVVNTTKVGLRKRDPLLIKKKWFGRKKKLVYDLIYKPRMTKFLKSAREAGCQIQNGETMLLYQGAQAFEIWTGKKAPISLMKKALDHELRSS